MFGGLGASNTSDGDVYVLTLPSFRWIRVKEGSKLCAKHKCVLANKHTMISVGGTVPQDGGGNGDGDEWDPAPVDCDTAGKFANGIGIFDLKGHTWSSRYDIEDQGEYTLNKDITHVIGGR